MKRECLINLLLEKDMLRIKHKMWNGLEITTLNGKYNEVIRKIRDAEVGDDEEIIMVIGNKKMIYVDLNCATKIIKECFVGHGEHKFFVNNLEEDERELIRSVINRDDDLKITKEYWNCIKVENIKIIEENKRKMMEEKKRDLEFLSML